MKKLILVLLTAVLATSASAEGPPITPEGGITWDYQSPCVEKETQEEGVCFLGYDREGTYYMTFWQNNQLMLIRKVVGDSYETIWTADRFNTI